MNRPASDREDVRDAQEHQLPSPAEECEFCGAPMYGLHCKLVCPNCGYRRDCSDP